MELMSSLLLCALVAYFPQALGENDTDDIEVKHLARIYHQKPQRKKILLNLHGPPLVNTISDLQYVFMDVRCKKCIDCMERAIKAFKRHVDMIKRRPSPKELEQEILAHKYLRKYRPKRSPITETKLKKTKSKKKSHKSITVTKYNINGKVYGLKIKEIGGQTSEQIGNKTALCHIYSIKKSYECDTPESESFLASAKRKVAHKKIKKEKEKPTSKTVISTSRKPYFVAQSFKKRHADNVRAELPENFETSVEDIMSY